MPSGHLKFRTAYGNVGTRTFRGARYGDALSPKFEGLLDLYGGAAAAYSLRALSSGWLAGDVVEVRRSSDSATQDFTASQITNGDLVAFCGVGDGFVSTWYDQSGNGNDATQITTTAQPKIVSAGSLVTGGIDFDGVDDGLALSGTGLDIFKNVGYGQVFSVITPDNAGTGSARYFEVAGGVSGARLLLGDSQDFSASARIGGRRLDADGFQDVGSSTTHGNSETLITGFLNWTDSDAFLYFNGAQVATSSSFQTDGNTSNTSSAGVYIGGNPIAAFGDFNIKELIIYNTDQSANRAGVESNINDHYSIY